jgi:hypothetical protein
MTVGDFTNLTVPVRVVNRPGAVAVAQFPLLR